MPKKDINQLAKFIVDQAIGDVPKPAPLNAKQLAGRKGGQKGGKARMDAMSDEQRTALAIKGVAARKTPASSGAGAGKVTKSGS